MCADCPLVEAPAPPRLDESFLQRGSAAFLSALLQSADRPRPLDKLVSFNICKRRKEVSAGPSEWNESSETAVGGRGSAKGRSSGGRGVADRVGHGFRGVAGGEGTLSREQDRNCANGAQWPTGRSEQSAQKSQNHRLCLAGRRSF